MSSNLQRKNHGLPRFQAAFESRVMNADASHTWVLTYPAFALLGENDEITLIPTSANALYAKSGKFDRHGFTGIVKDAEHGQLVSGENGKTVFPNPNPAEGEEFKPGQRQACLVSVWREMTKVEEDGNVRAEFSLKYYVTYHPRKQLKSAPKPRPKSSTKAA